MAEEVLGTIILEVAIGVVLGVEILVPNRYLPQQYRFTAIRLTGGLQILLPAVEVGVRYVEPVPPAVLSKLNQILPRVAIERVVEQDVVGGPGLAQKAANLLAEGTRVRGRARVHADVVARGPRTDLQTQQHVWCVEVAQMRKCLDVPGIRIREASHRGIARGRDSGFDKARIISLARAEAVAGPVHVVCRLDRIAT